MTHRSALLPPRRPVRSWILSLLLFLAAPVTVASGAAQPPAQDPAQGTVPPEGDSTRVPPRPGSTLDVLKTLETLEALIADQQITDSKLQGKKVELENATTPEQKALLQAELDALEQESDRLALNFQSVATNFDVARYYQKESESFELMAELRDLLRPIIEELKSATESPRQIEQLKSDLAYHQDRRRRVILGVQHIDRLLEAVTQEVEQSTGSAESELESVRERLIRAREDWDRERKKSENAETFARYQLEAKQRDQKPLLESSRNLLANFFRTRGRNLVLSVLTFFAVFFGLRLFHGLFLRWGPVQKRLGRNQYLRVFSVLYYLLVAVLAVLASLMVLYAFDDSFLLGLALLLLFGLGWASKHAIPTFLEQIRLLLNFGTVREGERVIYQGLPWKVHRLSFYTRFRNPDLTNGKLRLPLRILTELTSRPCHPREPWFPCRESDWVRLADGRWGQILAQTPEMVLLQRKGSSRLTYQTAHFLSLNPENISYGFRLTVPFGIDYSHQAICTTVVPEKMRRWLREKLIEMVTESNLNNLLVEFSSAGASSLDYEVLADFSGKAAARYAELRRAIQRHLVDLCNQEGWIIPFTQLTVHQAEPGDAVAGNKPRP